MRRRLRFALGLLSILAVTLAAGGFRVRTELRGSLPVLDGTIATPGLAAAVWVTRDALGIPTVRGSSREDVARATGFLHAQDRFFQMDLARRRAAGELSELVGSRALAVDRETRLHRFRAEARRATSLLNPRDAAVLAAYTGGVNAGLAALKASPFEYLLLRQTPAAWRDEDTFLVVLSMFTTLQETDGAYEATLATMHDTLPPEMFDFLAPRGTEWDAPLVGSAFMMPPVPGPGVYNLRARRAGKPTLALPDRVEQVRLEQTTLKEGAIGSNNWAVSGRLSPDGQAILANDMHLSIRVPNTWYRAVLEWTGPGDGRPHRLVGVTLPGVPALVVGSNTQVAWGFTNTYADWSDIVLLEVDPGNANRYRTPEGWRDFERHEEIIKVAGQLDERIIVSWTLWGPVIGPDHRGRPRAYRWVAHSAERLANTLTPLEDARTIEDAFDAANGLGTPGQNFVVVDRSGRIGWSVYGAVPRRVGLDGRLPLSWADGTHRWDGWLTPAEYPRVIDPPSGRIWTANARVVDGEMLAKLGDGSYEVGSRATIIRNHLLASDRFTKADLFALQLDTSADFLSRWRDLLLGTLDASAVEDHRGRAEVLDILRHEWSGQASADSVAYRLTRAFREQVTRRIVRFVLAECYEANADFDYMVVRRREGPIWALVTSRPAHLLDPQYSTWKELLLSAVDDVIGDAEGGWFSGLRDRVWSEYNVTRYRHPLSGSVPLLGRWLDMPARTLPGDLFTPRMHWGAAGASERMVVSPGHEDEGIMHMPTGQSGHPLSPFYGSSHEAWANGTPTPLMPGPTAHTLTLIPMAD